LEPDARADIAELSDRERELDCLVPHRGDVGGANDEQRVDDAAMATADAESIETTFIVPFFVPDTCYFVSQSGGAGGGAGRL
jgi:hypothetical protein